MEQNIIQVDFYGNRQRIGVTQSAYDELEKISNEYYNKLVELKVITPPKTSEEIQQEQTQLMADMLKFPPAQTLRISRHAEHQSDSRTAPRTKHSLFILLTVQVLQSAEQPPLFSKTIRTLTEALQFPKFSDPTWALIKSLIA